MMVQPAAFPAAMGPLELTISPGVRNKAPPMLYFISSQQAPLDVEVQTVSGGIRQSFANLLAWSQDPISDKTLRHCYTRTSKKKSSTQHMYARHPAEAQLSQTLHTSAEIAE